uniref:Uncharacterized protein n=1 Tax=Physcomitrium patens TaxID=3218 RepID=A0A2K1JGE3_PHYPA|nr:hypothetical protein PHYPA_017982 [Physcomitrium patens]
MSEKQCIYTKEGFRKGRIFFVVGSVLLRPENI